MALCALRIARCMRLDSFDCIAFDLEILLQFPKAKTLHLVFEIHLVKQLHERDLFLILSPLSHFVLH